MTEHYGLARARRSLLHFGAGKAASAVTSLALLILLARHVPAEQFGLYVAILATLEIFYLTTGFGLSSAAQRYVAEYRMRARGEDFLRFAAGLVAARTALAVVFSVLAWALSPLLLPMAGLGGARDFAVSVAALMALGTVARYLEEILGALLMQGTIQALTLVRNVAKLAVVLSLSSAGLLNAQTLVATEAVVLAMSAAAGSLQLMRHLRATRTQPGEPAYRNERLWRVSMRFYLVQVMGLAYGPDVMKLLVTRAGGSASTAALGFAQSITDTLRNYLPAHLLASWIRPMMVSRYVSGRGIEDLALLGNLILKLNLFGLAPVVAFFSAHGNAFGSLLSAGRYPDAGALLTAFGVFAALQSAHLVLNMITVTVERAGANIASTALAAFTIPVALLAAPGFGAVTAAWLLVTAEVLWCVSNWLLLRRAGIRLRLAVRSFMKIGAAGTLAGAVGMLASVPGESWLAVGLNGLLVASVFLGVAAMLRPFDAVERALLGKFVPARWLVW